MPSSVTVHSRDVAALGLALVVAAAGCSRSKSGSGSSAGAGRGAAQSGRSAGGRAAAADRRPAIRVTVTVPGLDAAAIEQAVTRPLEEAVGQLDGVASLRSESINGRVVLRVTLDAGVDSHVGLERLFQALTGVQAQLPPAAEPPVLERESRGAPIIYVLRSAAGDSGLLSRIDSQTLVPALQPLAGVIRVTRCGQDRPTLTITADPDRLAARGVDAADLSRALSGALGAMSPAPTGADIDALAQVSVAPTHPAQAAGGTTKARRAAAPVRVGDVASVTIQRHPDCVAHAGGHGTALIGEVWLDPDRSDADRARTGAAIGAALARATKALPGGVTLETFTDGASPLVALALDPAAGTDPLELVRRADAVRAALVGIAGVSNALLEVDVPADLGDAPGMRARLLLSRDADAARVVSAATARLPDVTVRVAAGAAADRVVVLTSDELDDLSRLAPRLADTLRHTDGVAAAGVGAGARTRASLAIEPDRARLAQLGVAAADLYTAVQAAMTSDAVGTIRLHDQSVPVRVRLGQPAGRPTDLAAVLQRVKVENNQGSLVSLAELARLETRSEPRLILHVDRRRAAELWWRAAPGRPAAPIEAALKKRLGAQVPLSTGTLLVWPPAS